jgi:hypothetical protein
MSKRLRSRPGAVFVGDDNNLVVAIVVGLRRPAKCCPMSSTKSSSCSWKCSC